MKALFIGLKDKNTFKLINYLHLKVLFISLKDKNI